MQARTISLLALSLVCGVFSVLAEGSFQNLGFEGAHLSPIPAGQYGGSVPIADALPGWSGFLGTDQMTEVLQNNLTLGNASIDILGPYWSFWNLIEGQYTLVLQPGANPSVGGYISASISQTGLVPLDARSLQFKANSGPFSVSLAGHELSLVVMGAGSNYTLYGADISSVAGQSGVLVITALAGPNTTDSFDSIVFSPVVIPEPSVFSLLASVALLFGRRVAEGRRPFTAG